MDVDIVFDKTLWGIIASFITTVAILPYIVSTINGTVRPHVFTWLIWSISTCVVFIAQLYEGGAAGAWSTGIAGGFSISITVLAWWKNGDSSIKKSDWCYLVIALAAIPLWYITDDPLVSVIVLVGIDLIAYIPTFRKSYDHPYEENIWTYAVMTLRNIASIYALGHYSWVTIMFPALTGLANVLLILMLVIRRQS